MTGTAPTAYSEPPATHPDRIRQQACYAVEQGWSCAIEHAADAADGDGIDWRRWQLVQSGVQDAEAILRELEACRRRHPGHVLRLIGYEDARQILAFSFVIN